jgi:hypothetical protein
VTQHGEAARAADRRASAALRIVVVMRHQHTLVRRNRRRPASAARHGQGAHPSRRPCSPSAWEECTNDPLSDSGTLQDHLEGLLGEPGGSPSSGISRRDRCAVETAAREPVPSAGALPLEAPSPGLADACSPRAPGPPPRAVAAPARHRLRGVAGRDARRRGRVVDSARRACGRAWAAAETWRTCSTRSCSS